MGNSLIKKHSQQSERDYTSLATLIKGNKMEILDTQGQISISEKFATIEF